MLQFFTVVFGLMLSAQVAEANTDVMCPPSDTFRRGVELACADSVSPADCRAQCPGAPPPPGPQQAPPPPPPFNPPPWLPTPTPGPTPIPTPTPTCPMGGTPNPMTGCRPPCTSSESRGDYGSCEGSFGPWNKVTHTRTYSGSECRTITTTSSCGGSTTRQDCRPCSYEQQDVVSPTCESVVDWGTRPLVAVVLNCEDDLAGCDETAYTDGSINGNRTGISPASACDEAGNCSECPITNPDNTPPTCTATFRHPGRWHRADEFEVNGGDLRCWLESCEDVDGDGAGNEVASGCLPLGTLENTEKNYNDVGGMIEQVQVEQDPLDPVHRDFCVMQVCDNAGNCNTCQSPEVGYDGTDVCRSAIGFCGACAEDDYDCRCISGERDVCTNSGPINCYADPFNERCPGFDNQACLTNAFIPGCPVFNPCYPIENREHPRVENAQCPADAVRFCARNPYHYGCNEACKFGLIECVPDAPDGE